MYRRGGQTTPHTGRRGVSATKSRKIIEECREKLEELHEALETAQRFENKEDEQKLSLFIADYERAIETHQEIIRQAETTKVSVSRTIQRRIDHFQELREEATREVDRAAYQQLITNEVKALRTYRAL